MNIEEYEKMFKLEEKYWWFVGKWRLMSFLLESSNLTEDARILDVGCGCGLGLSRLSRYGTVVGVDKQPEALRYCRSRLSSASLVRASAELLPFKRETFDLIVALDLLEHLDDDGAFLRELLYLCKPKAKVMISVPCYQILFSEHDKALHHKRRYSRSGISNKALDAGFTVIRATFFNMVLFLPIAVVRVLKKPLSNRGQPKSDSYFGVGTASNRLLAAILRFEARLCRGLNLPFGLSLYMVLERTEKKA
jgi:SAM-dependent methyltransferase